MLNKSLQHSDYSHVILLTVSGLKYSSVPQLNTLLRRPLIRKFSVKKMRGRRKPARHREEKFNDKNLEAHQQSCLCPVFSFPQLQKAKPSHLWQSINFSLKGVFSVHWRWNFESHSFVFL